MAHTYKLHRGSSAGLPVFNLDQKPQSHDALHDRLHIKGVAEQQALPTTGFNHSTLRNSITDYHHCGGKRSSKASRNSSAPKPRPPAASIINEASRRVHSMRILSTSKTLSAEGLPLDWRDDTHSSLSKPPKKGVGPGGARPSPFNVNSSMDSSISFSRGGFSQELIPSKSKPPSARQQSPGSNKTKAAFKYLSAKMVAEKLVKALTKDRTSQGEITDKVESLEAQKGRRNPKVNGNVDNDIKPSESINDGGNGYQVSSPRASIEYQEELHTHQNGIPSRETRLANLNSEMALNPASTEISFYDVLDPLEARARAFEEQATILGTGNELSDVLIRTLADDGDCEYDTLEIHIDVLRKEFRNHIEDKRDLALKMAAELRARLSERARAEETLKKARAEMESKLRTMEREMVEMKSRLQEDMEESETQWVSKFERMKSKEKRLSERLKEILEEKVELHKEVSSLTTKKNALVEEVQGYQQSIKSFKERAEESMQEVAKLRKVLEVSVAATSSWERVVEGSREKVLEGSMGKQKEKVLEGSMEKPSENVLEGSMGKPSEKVLEGSMGKLTEEEGNTLARRYRHKEKEVMEKQKVVGKLQKLCREQEKTISGLRFALGEQANNAPQLGKGEFFVKLQRELVRLTGIEQGLRKEIEAYKGEALAARRENASLVERLGTIMKKLGSAALKMADPIIHHDLEPLHHKPMFKPAHYVGDNGTSVMRLEEIYDDDHEGDHHAELALPNNNSSMALVLLDHYPSTLVAHSTHTLDAAAADNPRLSEEVKDPITSELDLAHCRKSEEIEKLRAEVRNLIQNRARLEQEASNLHNALSLTNRRVQELETQLVSKEKELGGIHEELERVREQRDSVQKEADFMGREAIRLSAQVDRLSRKVERLDEDVMVKDGQLSILRGALHDNSE